MSELASLGDLKPRVRELLREYEEKLEALVAIPTVSMDPARRPQMDACVVRWPAATCATPAPAST